MPPPTISIIGAGLSGLALGRCLLRRGIPSIIFDRDDASTGSKRHNYGITLSPRAFRPLLKALDIDEGTFRRTLSVDCAFDGGGRVERSTAKRPEESGPFRANRRKLEGMLREGLDVRWEHNLVTVSVESTIKTLSFDNGHHAQAGLLVACDGVHSQVRQIVSSASTATPSVLPCVVYNGRRRISIDTFLNTYAAHMKDAAIIEHQAGRTLLRISIDDVAEQRVSLSYTYSRPARRNDPLFTPGRATTGAKTIPAELFSEIAELSTLPQPFKDIFNAEKMRDDRLLNWLMRSVIVDLSSLEAAANKGIMLLGDAAHAQPILGGHGANVAIVDGVRLAECIAAGGDGTKGLVEFYDERHATWWKGVKKSEYALAEMHAEVKPSL